MEGSTLDKIKAVYYMEDCLECYTVIFNGKNSIGDYEYLGCSENGLGVSMFGEIAPYNIGKHLGKKIKKEDLPIALVNHVHSRLQ